MLLYMAVTNDRYELPIAVAETPGELAAMLGITKQTVFVNLCRPAKTKRKILKIKV